MAKYMDSVLILLYVQIPGVSQKLTSMGGRGNTKFLFCLLNNLTLILIPRIKIFM